jgi:uncharacterized surface protein with fasciclin (FAS1) repeats
MRRLLIVLALLLLPLPSVHAQDGSLIETLAADPAARFVTLVTALEAARLGETLSAEGDFTLFAPTDAAFDAALEVLDVPLDVLLGDTDTLTTLLTYHLVPGRLAAADLAAAGVLASAQGEPLTVVRAGDAVRVNDASITEADIAASNGTIHVIDTLLLPPSLVPAEADAEAPAESAHLRFVHFSPDTPVVDIYLDEDVGAGELELLDSTDWMTFPAGDHRLTVTPAGTSVEQAALPPLALSLAVDSWTTVALIGSLGSDTLALAPIPEDYTPIPAGSARLTVFHAVEGAPPIDLTTDSTRVLVSALAYPGTQGNNDGAFTVNQAAGVFDLQVIRSGAAQQVAVAVTPFAPAAEGSPLFIDLPGVELVENVNYLVAAVGVPSAPQLFIVPTVMASVSTQEE